MLLTTTCRGCGSEIPSSELEDAYCVECRYHNQPEEKPWDAPDEFGNVPTQPEGSVDFQYPDDECPGQETEWSEFDDRILRLLFWLAKRPTIEDTGRKTLYVLHIAGKSRFKTDADLCQFLNISPGRGSQYRSEIEEVLPGFGRCNSRQAKGGSITSDS